MNYGIKRNVLRINVNDDGNSTNNTHVNCDEQNNQYLFWHTHTHTPVQHTRHTVVSVARALFCFVLGRLFLIGMCCWAYGGGRQAARHVDGSTHMTEIFEFISVWNVKQPLEKFTLEYQLNFQKLLIILGSSFKFNQFISFSFVMRCFVCLNLLPLSRTLEILQAQVCMFELKSGRDRNFQWLKY